MAQLAKVASLVLAFLGGAVRQRIQMVRFLWGSDAVSCKLFLRIPFHSNHNVRGVTAGITSFESRIRATFSGLSTIVREILDWSVVGYYCATSTIVTAPSSSHVQNHVKSSHARNEKLAAIQHKHRGSHRTPRGTQSSRGSSLTTKRRLIEYLFS